MLGSARGRWCNSSGLLTQLLTRRRSFGMGLFIDKPEQGRLVSSRLVSLLLLVAAPAGRAVDLARASHRIKRRNAPPKPLVFQCRLLAMTPYLRARPGGRTHHQLISSVRHERSSSIVAPMATSASSRSAAQAALVGRPADRRSDRRGPEPNFSKKMESAAALWRPQRVALSTSCARVIG